MEPNYSNMAKQTPILPHVLIFPLPLQGPVNCMLKLAELLCLENIQVTFLNTEHIQKRLRNSENYFKRYPNFVFQSVPDGLPEENPRTIDQFYNLVESMQAVTMPVFRKMVSCGTVSCIIADPVYTFAIDIANEFGVYMLCFDTISPCAVSTLLCLPELIEAGELPFRDDNLDEIIRNIPAMEGILRRRDLPYFCRSKDLNDSALQQVLKQTKQIPLVQGFIFNSFQQLEAPVLSQFLKIYPKTYVVGPIHAHLNARIAEQTTLNSLWKEDISCIAWLDSQPSKSVIYVSIGSLAVMTKEQLFEIWHGLVNSGSRFLWARRPDSVIGSDSEFEIPFPLSQGTKERGYIVGWAPQENVLAHPAIGGFFTHSGWNSTLESIVEGKPMICWPQEFDQQVNSRFVGEVWKLGLDMKDTCDRVIVEKMVRELMESKKDEFLERAVKMSRLAKASVDQGGSSFQDLNRLIEDIKLMKKIPATQN